jgi:predicted  nucleic acid-binding Zn ribbon protein
MILYEVTFGPVDRKNRQEAEDVVQSYIAGLLHNGQAYGQYFLISRNGFLTGYINLADVQAKSLSYHSEWGRKDFKKVKAFFEKAPQWKLLDDAAPKRQATYKDAPFLYLFTHMFDYESPLCRGDNGKLIPYYRLLGTYQERNDIYCWQGAYREHDSIWIGSGKLEIPAYKQLAEPFSELSEYGIKICKTIEKITGIPTYYYLMLYFGRRKDEDKRKCPSCGRVWRTKHPMNNSIFWHFPFQCEKCRLVSHAAVSYDNRRLAAVGEFKTDAIR